MPSLSQAVVIRCASFLLLGLLLSAGWVDASARELPPMPPGAFLRRPVADVEALTRELRTDSLVTARYSRLLRLPPALVCATFAQLHLVRLRRDTLLSVHYVHAHETIGAKMRRVRKGTLVFALPDGTPLLAQVCGNPLRGGDPRGHLTLRPSSAEGPPWSDREASLGDIPDFDPTEPLNPSIPAVPSHTITLRDAPPPELFPESQDQLAPDEIPADTLKVEESLPACTVAQAGNSVQVWAIGSALVGIIGVVSGHGDSALPPVREPVLLPGDGGKGGPSSSALTPEPNSLLLAMALATALLAHRGLRRHRVR